MHTDIASAHSLPNGRDRLLSAAAQLFATRGFQATALRDLAQHLGLHAGSLYNHIENKQALLFELIESALYDVVFRTAHRMARAKNASERLHGFIQTFVDFHVDQPHKLALITREFVNLNAEQRDQVSQLQDRYVALLSAIISETHGEQCPVDGHRCATAEAIVVVLFGQAHWYSGQTHPSQLAEALSNIALRLIAPGNITQAPAAMPILRLTRGQGSIRRKGQENVPDAQ